MASRNISSDIWQLVRSEKKDLGVIFGYSVVIGLFSLIVPLVTQAIVNSVGLGIVTSQFYVLCGTIFFGLVLLGIFSLLERYTADILRRRLFVQTAFDIAHRIPHIRRSALQNEYLPELINRFFEVVIIQKTLNKILLDGMSSALTIIAGMMLLAVYHPFFLLFDLLLLLYFPFLIFILGRNGFRSSIKVSKQKYALVEWMEEIARCQLGFKMAGESDLIFSKTDSIATAYAETRAVHFRVIIRQLAGSYFFKAVAMTAVLGLGGALVLGQQMTLGQLVAAELVVISMLTMLEKLTEQFEDYYDFFTALNKLSYLTEKELEPVGGEGLSRTEGALEIAFRKVSFSYPGTQPVLSDLSMKVPKGSRISIVGNSGSGKTTLSELLIGLYKPDAGVIEVGGRDISRIDLQELRRSIGYVPETDEIFFGTIEENITLGRDFSYEQIRTALETSGIWEEVLGLPDGLRSILSAQGKNFPKGFVRRLMFARAIIGKPGILILDEAFGGLEECTKSELIDALYHERGWTLIDISHDAELIERSEMIFVLENGRIAESGTPKQLASEGRFFCRLFPELVGMIRDKEVTEAMIDAIPLQKGK